MEKHYLSALAGLALGLTCATGASASVYSPSYVMTDEDHAHDEFEVPFSKWGSPTLGTGAAVTWSLSPSGIFADAEDAGLELFALSTFMPFGFHAQIVAAFAAWSAVADITFTEVTDSGDDFNTPGAEGDIRIGGHVFDGVGGTLAHGYYPQVGGPSFAGDIHFDMQENWKIGFGGGGFDIFTVTAHEIGHAIGLGHTDVASSLMNPYYTEAFVGPQADDIAGAQYLYGPATVPVPAALPLLMGGLTMIGFVGRRKRAA